jgi:hypothetical protein
MFGIHQRHASASYLEEHASNGTITATDCTPNSVLNIRSWLLSGVCHKA